jgi:hypothetical protein
VGLARRAALAARQRDPVLHVRTTPRSI